jgi:opacity protein-like surface antigen
MRSLLALAALALLLAPAASAQLQADSQLTIEGLSASSTNETVAALPFQVRFDLSNFPCLGEGAEIRVALTAAATPEGNATATVQPEALTFVVPPTQGVAGYSNTQAALLTLRPATPGAGNYTAKVHAEFDGVSGCTMATAEGLGTDAEAPVAFLAPRGAAVATEGPAMPGPGLALLALGLAAAALARRSA